MLTTIQGQAVKLFALSSARLSGWYKRFKTWTQPQIERLKLSVKKWKERISSSSTVATLTKRLRVFWET